LGAPFQVDSGRLAETKGASAAIRGYAHLMVTSHIPVVDALNVILKHKNITPSNTLLHSAYNAMISTLKAGRGAAFDRDHVNTRTMEPYNPKPTINRSGSNSDSKPSQEQAKTCSWA
jgi:predicted outer membrane protein